MRTGTLYVMRCVRCTLIADAVYRVNLFYDYALRFILNRKAPYRMWHDVIHLLDLWREPLRKLRDLAAGPKAVARRPVGVSTVV
jgi:hypothetical protein